MTDSVVIKHKFNTTIDRLFSLLSTPKMLEQWLSPSENVLIKVLEHDFKIGGVYRLCYTQPDGVEVIVKGEFTDVVEPNRIEFTWIWQEPDMHAGMRTLVTWSLRSLKDVTELTVVHSELPDGGYADRHKSGWLGAIDRLQLFVGDD